MKNRIGPVLSMLAWPLALIACGGKNDLAAPTTNLTGTWQIVATSTSSGCGREMGEQETITAAITHAENSNSFTLSAAPYGTANGTIDGDHLSFGFSVTAEDCSPLAVNMDMTLDSTGNSASGSGGFDCTYSGGSCGGQYDVTAVRIAGEDPSSGPAAELCDKFEECSLVEPGLSEICEMSVGSMAMYVVDPSAVGACLAEATCEQIADDTFIQQCLAYDTTQFDCTGSTTLHVCNMSGACKDVDCSQACQQFFPGSSAGCGLDSTDGYDKCICVI